MAAYPKMIVVASCLLALFCISQAQFQGSAGPGGFSAQAPGGFGFQAQPNFPQQPQQPQGSFQGQGQVPNGGNTGFNFGKK
ncbi:hypothetical protein J6590_083427 [Homalodisca vitripennis]|nr:hypothetical protein J6590_093063 [Homalodisca vitripennis]KAG8270548.1 hypothetical protein J6590_083427 [Homalodisca vitripennis]